MYYYNLISCNSSLWPDLGPFYHPTIHNYIGDIVIIGIDVSKYYTLVQISGTEQAAGPLPYLNWSPYTTCDQTEHYYNLINCRTGEERAYLFPSAQTIDQVIKFQDDCNVWKIDEYEQQPIYGLAPTVEDTYVSCYEGLQDLQFYACEVGEVSKGYAVRASSPDQAVLDNEFDCCYFEQKVLASSADDDVYKNDYTSFYYQAQTANDAITFKLIKLSDSSETVLSSANYGTLATSGGLTTYYLNWKSVLVDAGMGAGLYQVKKEITVAGQTTDVLSMTYRLSEYTQALADKTVRFDAEINGHFENSGITFSEYRTSFRVPGFFGRANPQYTQDNIVHSDYTSKQVSISVVNEYQFQSNLLPSCVTEELLYFTFLADSLKVTDYNANNHRYNIIELPVVLADSAEPSYYVRSTKARLSLTFTDKVKNILKRNC